MATHAVDQLEEACIGKDQTCQNQANVKLKAGCRHFPFCHQCFENQFVERESAWTCFCGETFSEAKAYCINGNQRVIIHYKNFVETKEIKKPQLEWTKKLKSTTTLHNTQ